MEKNIKTRILSLILALSLLFSCTTVLSYAFDGVSLVSEDILDPEYKGNGDNVVTATKGVSVQLNRTFDEVGYDNHKLGFIKSDGSSSMTGAMAKDHTITLGVDKDGSLTGVAGNKYLSLVANEFSGNYDAKDGYFQFHIDQKHAGETLVIRLDMLFDATRFTAPGSFIRFTDTAGKSFRGLEMLSAGYRFWQDKTTLKTDTYNAKKHTLTYVIKSVGTNQTEASVWIDGEYHATKSTLSANISYLRIGFFGDQAVGTEVGIDNFTVYYCDPTKVTDPLNVDLGYTMGYNIDHLPYNDDLFMKIGIPSAYSNGKKLDNVNVPVLQDGKAFIPVDVLADYLGYKCSIDGNVITLTKDGADSVILNVGSYNAVVGASTVTLRAAVASVDGKYPVIYYRDVNALFPTHHGSYNDMGLIAVSVFEGYATIASTEELLDRMKRFIFNSIDGNLKQIDVIDYDDLVFDKETGEKREHPYILADADDFAYYREIYNAGAENNPEPLLYSYIAALVTSAENAYNKYKKESGTGDAAVCVGMNSKYIPKMPYDTTRDNGYDPSGGRQNDTDSYGTIMRTLAFGYQITHKENYARLAYYYGEALGTYEHWGPAHFLNCADTAAPFAIAYDWLYNAWGELEAKYPDKFQLNVMTDALFRNGLLAGWYGINGVRCPWVRRHDYKRTNILDSSHFYKMENNWNAVCASGMLVTALALASETDTIEEGRVRDIRWSYLTKDEDGTVHFAYKTVPYNYTGNDIIEEYDGREKSNNYIKEIVLNLGDHTGYNSYADYALQVFNKIHYTLPLYGLDLYAPDGSYVESVSYWAYSADNLFSIGAYCDKLFGTEFGLITRCWGLDKTGYFALNAQSSDYAYWNYSDSGEPGKVSTKSFPYIAYTLGDPGLAAIRKDMVKSGEYGASFLDVFYYDENKSATEYELPALQYHMAGIDSYVARDSWEPGSTYIAIKGGYNDSAHGQVDSGSFVYHNNGTIWFCDIGTDSYNLAGWGGAISGYRYYKMNAEGNNTLALSTNPLRETITDKDTDGNTNCCFAGQYSYGTGHMYEVGDNEHGAYTLIDQTEVYYKEAVSAKRGMLFTNDRKTVVIQDEVKFHDYENVYWVGHTAQEIRVSTDGKTAYMTDGKSVIRVSLISSIDDLEFEVMSTYEFLLEDTFPPEYALENGTGKAEGDRSKYCRLVVKCENIKELNLSVVIEDVTADSEMEVGYSFVPMDDWVPSADERDTSEVDETIDFDGGNDAYTVDGELDVYNTYFVDSNMLTVTANAATAIGDGASIKFSKSAFRYATLAGDYAVFDMDAYTDSHAGGFSLVLYGNGSELASLALSELVGTGGEWSHITVIVSDNAVYFYKDGVKVAEAMLHSVSFKDMHFAVVATSLDGGTVSLDNIRARRIDAEGIDLSSITSWDGYTGAKRAKTAVFSYTGASGEVIGYTFSELLALDYAGKDITFHQSNEHAPIAIEKACRIIHKDGAFRATSPTLSAYISDGVTEFKDDSITVYWHIGNKIETSLVKGMQTAVYEGESVDFSTFTEKLVGGRSVFYGNGWSTSPNGAIATDDEMLVTSENYHFYLVNNVASNLFFYEDSTGKLVASNDASKLFSTLGNKNYKRVILNSDIEVSGAGKKYYNDAVLDLNGYTLTFNHTSGEVHMFWIAIDSSKEAYGALTIYGRGGSIVKNGNYNIFYPVTYNSNNGHDYIIKVEDTKIYSTTSMMDHRSGHVIFKNVELNQSSSSAYFTFTQNRTNGNNDNGKKPKLTLDGCTLNHLNSTASTTAITVAKNAELIITGGTRINVPNGTAIELHNNYISGGNTEEYVDFTNMSVTIEDATINAAKLYAVSTVIPYKSGDIYKYYSPKTANSATIFDGSFDDEFTEAQTKQVLLMAEKIQLGNNVVLNQNFVPESNIIDGCKLSRRNDQAFPYVVTEDYTTVTWKANGKDPVVEYWLNGSLPEPDSDAVAKNIASLNAAAPSGKKYTYSVTKVVGGEKTFEATILNGFNISMSLTLEASMKANLYVEKREGIDVRGFAIDGINVDYTETTFSNGKTYYKVVLPNLLPTDAAKRHECSVRVIADDNNEAIVRIYFSVIDYCDKILSNGQSYDKKACGLMANIINYVKSAYEYAGYTDTIEYDNVKAVFLKHVNKITYSDVKKNEAPDLSGVKDALKSVQILLSDAPRYRFDLVSGYTGQVVLKYNAYGKEVTRTYEIKDGKYNDKAYIELELKAHDIRNDITITTAGGEGVYNLNAYYNATKGSDATALLNALYAYSEMAAAYKESLAN